MTKAKVSGYRMRKFRIKEASFVDRPAQAGATALFMKRDDEACDDGESDWPLPRVGESRTEYLKRFVSAKETARDMPALTKRLGVGMSCYDDAVAVGFEKCGGSYGEKPAAPVMTSDAAGHAHLIWLRGERGGETSYSSMKGEEYSHGHPWTIGADGALTIGASRGHTHEVDQASVMAAMRELLLATSDTTTVVADVVFARSADGVPVDVEKMDLPELLSALDDGSIVATTDSEPLGKAYRADGSFPIRTLSDMVNAIAMYEADPQADVARHIVKRARVLGLTDQGGVALAEIAKSIASPAGEHTTEVSMTSTTKGAAASTAATAPTAEEFAKMQGELAVARAEATLTDRQRAHYSKLEGDAKGAFLKLDGAARDAALEAIEKGDPIVHTSADGTVYRKSDDPRMVALAKKADEQADALAKANADATTAAFEKRAASELGNLAGDTPTHVALLRAVDGIKDEAVRKSVSETLKAVNTVAAGLFEKKGARTPAGADESGDPGQQLDTLAKKHMADKGGNYADAYDIVSKAHPDLLKAAVAKGR